MTDAGFDSSGAGDASEPPSRQPLAVRAVGSSAWSMFGQIVQVGLGVASFALLSRWLAPSDYGLMGMAATASAFVGVVGDVGVSSLVIRLPTLDAEAESTAFWLSIMGGIVLAIVTAIAAPLIAHFYRNPALLPLASRQLSSSRRLAAYPTQSWPATFASVPRRSSPPSLRRSRPPPALSSRLTRLAHGRS
jgi:O-antigen/teichoic acid export membrane protein